MGKLFDEIVNSDMIAIDTETTGTYYPRDKAFSVSVSTKWSDTYIDFRSDRTGATDELLSAIARKRPIIAAHNASFDVKMLSSAGYNIQKSLFQCTMVRASLINEHESTVFPWSKQRGGYSLDYLSDKYLGTRKDEDFHVEACEYFGLPDRTAKGRIMERISELPASLVGRYAKKDSRLAYDLWQWQQKEITLQGIQDIVSFEQKLFPVIVESEMRGIHVDKKEAYSAMDKLTVLIDKSQKDLNKIVGHEFNVNSSPQVRDLFQPYQSEQQWYASDGTPLETTGAGKPSFGGLALHNMTHPVAASIVEIRSLIKTRDTFLGSHIIGHEYEGRVYPNINQVKGEDGGTGTGRLSYTDPAMQQIPTRNKTVAQIVKPCFKPPQGKVWLETDLASFEVRVFAHLVAAYNDNLVQAYKENPSLDFHQYVADETGLPRNATFSGEPNAKQLNLSMIFNQGRGATADKMGMPWEWSEFMGKDGKSVRYQKAGKEANKIINKYHDRVQGVHMLAERAKLYAEKQFVIKTAFGRRLRFPHGYKAYKASGILIQATSADINKRNWLVINEALGSDGHLILNMHDSYSMAVPEDWKRYYRIVSEAISDTTDMNFRVPLILDLDGAGYSWHGAKSGELK